MRPTLFHIGSSFPVHSYGLFIAVGMVLGVLLAVRRGRSVAMATGDTLDLTFYAIVAGLVGARGLYVAMHAREYARLCAGSGAPRSLGGMLSDCTAALRFWQGGLAFLGGGILAAVVVLLYARRKHLRLGDVADVLAPSVSLAHVFGRLGCLMAGCCYGKPWEAGVHFPPDSVAYAEYLSRRALLAGAECTPALHPTQLYESLGELLVFVGLVLLWRRRKFPGVVAIAYAFAYGILRFVVEIYRDDLVRGFVFQVRLPGLAAVLGLPPNDPLFLSSAQAASLLLIAAAATAYVVLLRREPPRTQRTQRPEDEEVSGS
ncbi:MAG: prolipoprotein diacylglyceryl transferase [Deltaproteobacteria bacterium]|jgi:phosphatidylglycerol:prolipoprotein diacylglycerol transferase|nr:prolipoprotein diacylglyceryl transferase [Deltaproteobacteria bacterium]